MSYLAQMSLWTKPKKNEIEIKAAKQWNLFILGCWCWYQRFKLLSHWYFASKSRDIFPETYFQRHIDLYMVNSPRSIEYWRTFVLISTESFAPIVKWSSRPHGLFAPPAALHAWEQTHHPAIRTKFEINITKSINFSKSKCNDNGDLVQ